MIRIGRFAGTLIFAVLLLSAGNADAILGGPRFPPPKFSTPVWLNSRPLTLDQLRGKVVLIDFWEYTCINCIRTFPELRKWNRLYGPLGLVIIGVHTPEFKFGEDPELVKAAVQRFGLDFPIAVDSDGKIWDAFHNYAWPADYLIDKDGRVADHHFGEGDYAFLESEIQFLLKEANPKLDFSSEKYAVADEAPQFGGACLRPTPETYLGTRMGQLIANEGGFLSDGKSYRAPKQVPPDHFALDGAWQAAPEFVKLNPESKSNEGALTLHYNATSVYLVGGSEKDSPQTLYVSQDGKPLPHGARGADVKQDASGRTYIALAPKRMYYLVQNPRFGEHTLKLTTSSPEIELYSFTFGNNCERRFDHK